MGKKKYKLTEDELKFKNDLLDSIHTILMEFFEKQIKKYFEQSKYSIDTDGIISKTANNKEIEKERFQNSVEKLLDDIDDVIENKINFKQSKINMN